MNLILSVVSIISITLACFYRYRGNMFKKHIIDSRDFNSNLESARKKILDEYKNEYGIEVFELMSNKALNNCN